ncbi:MAG: ketoacyl-ACP synthase III [Candidatus Krumholzibacteria bacterium]
MSARTIWTTIVGTGSYIPERLVANSDFLGNEFYTSDGQKIERSNQETIDKFEAITDIKTRRYVADDLQASDMAFFAAKDALASSKLDKESLDYVIVAHNFGDVAADNRRSNLVPTLAARVKHRLEIQNPGTIAYDLPFGCAGWLLALIQADYFIRSGDSKRALVIGAETLSRMSDPHDRDSMIYADGAGACVVEGVTRESPVGIMAHCSRSDTYKYAHLLQMGPSYNPDFDGSDLFLKMQGHKLYEYALRFVPQVVKECITKADLTLRDISKVLIHQANAKMDEAILERVYKLFGADSAPPLTMPMTISWLGNSSVATLPTLLDLLLKGKLEDHRLTSGQTIVFASVGAGMNINAVVYCIP